MGVVYKAEDTKLDRQVALKFLAAHLLNDDEAKERFLREAKAAAALHHPNVCPVHEIDEVNGKTFLAMAFLEGEPLEDRVTQGPLPIKDSLDVTRQVAEGLQAAHAKGIVHRDIKPANIMVDAKGRATILDFGLARLTEASKLTRTDQTVGTAAYMSPEQIQGAEVDQRTDIWALGCVLYEMVAGVRPFKGQYDQALAYEIVQEEPEPLTGVRAGLPMELEFIVSKCLAKDADERYSSASDLGVDLQRLGSQIASGRSNVQPLLSQPEGSAADASRKNRKVFALAVGALLFALGVGAGAFFVGSGSAEQPSVERPVRRWSFAPEALQLESRSAIISPDGRHIVYLAGPGEPKLWLRSLDDETPRVLPDTEGAVRVMCWSPDSQRVVYSRESELSMAHISGGPPTTMFRTASGILTAASWIPNARALLVSSYEAGGAVTWRADVDGGAHERFEGRDSGFFFDFMSPYGDGNSFLTDVGGVWDRTISLRDLGGGNVKPLIRGFYPVYSATGHLLFQLGPYAEPGLWAVQLSADFENVVGDSWPVSEDGIYASASTDNTLVYLTGGTATLSELTWRNRDGDKLGTAGRPQAGMVFVEISPSGDQVAVRSNEAGNTDIWIHDVNRPVARRFTFDEAVDARPVWSPQEDSITFSSHRDGDYNIYRRALDGSGEVERLIDEEDDVFPHMWTPDGALVFTHRVQGTSEYRDIKMRTRAGSEFTVSTLVSSPALKTTPQVSPSGRFIAYSSDESGRYEVYVRPFPSGEGVSQVSLNGGITPRWSKDGSALFFIANGVLTEAKVQAEPFMVGTPQVLFEVNTARTFAQWPMYDVSDDGLFLFVEPAESEESPAVIHVVENWFEEFRDRE